MSKNVKCRPALLLALAAVVVLCSGIPLIKVAVRQYDTARLARFSRRIAKADHIVVTSYGDPVSITIEGDDAAKVLQAVVSADPDRPPMGLAWSASYMTKAVFFRGTNGLAHIDLCGSAFLIHDAEPRYRDASKVLEALVEKPLSTARREYETSAAMKTR